jgi:NitT/TauT family transport system ATP-binding protein
MYSSRPAGAEPVGLSGVTGAQTPDAVIRCERLSRTYRLTSGETVHALQETSLSVPSGQFLCVVGPSGCGKTTLLNMIAGFIAPSSGSIMLRGEPIFGPGPERGVVFQEYSLFGWLTVRDNVEFGLRMAQIPAAERRGTVDRYLAMVGLGDVGGRYPFELSGGMKQRVAIARALAINPAVLLMDEPFAALDSMTRSSMQSELTAICQAERKTVIFITHNIGEALFLADRVVVMSSRPGRIVDDIPITMPRPRRRTTPTFNELYERIERLLGVEVAE